MIKITLPILFVFSIIRFSYAQEKSVEDALYKCLVSHYDNVGLHIEALLDSLEIHYVSEGILQDKSGKAKFAFYESIAENGELPTIYNYSIANKVSVVEFLPADINQCLRSNNVTSTTLKESKFYNLIEAYKTEEEITPQSAAKSQIKILSPEDFEHPYYRAHFLLTLAKIQATEDEFILEK